MQEFNAQPQMTSPYTPAGGGNMPAGMPSSPQLGAPIPGTTGGLPAKPGLSVFQNPMAPEFQSNPQNSAQQAQSYGRGNDSMLIHMTPDEVGGLQALAMAHGGSLTINPHTGLPEAGFLGKILPTILGALGAAVGLPTWALALGGTAAGTIASGGDLGKGLMAGLGAWGGASLAGGLGLGKAGEKLFEQLPKTGGEAISSTGFSNLGAANQALTASGTQIPAGAIGGGAAGAGAAGAGNIFVNPALTQAGTNFGANLGAGAGAALRTAALPSALSAYTVPGIGAGIGAGAAAGAQTAKTGLAGFAQRFGLKAAKDMPGFLGKYAPYAAGLGLVNTVSELTTPEGKKYNPDDEKSQWHYAKPQAPPKREVSYQTPEQMRESGGAEYTYFTPSNPVPGYSLTDEINKDYGYADGGLAALETPAGFNDLVSYFQSTSPGAITASRTYPAQASTAASTAAAAPAASQAERTYTFTNPQKPQTGSNATSATTLTSGQNVFIPGVGGFTLPDFSNMDWSSLAAQYGQGAGANAASTTQQTGTALTPAQQLNDLRNPQGTGPSARELAADNLAQDVQPTTPSYAGTDYSQYFSQTPSAGADTSAQPVQSVTAPDGSVVEVPPDFFDKGIGKLVGGGGKGGNPAPQEAAANASDYVSYPFASEGAADTSAQPTTPSYAGTDYSQYAPPPPAYDYSQYAPDFSNFSMPDFSGMDFSRYAPQTPQTPQAPPPPEYDYSQYTPSYYEYQYARGGEVPMHDGSFVMDARSVSELGNGSSNAGKEILARMGGRPLNGPGDGVSDSIPARIGGRQEARVARDEVIFPPQAVARIGGGSERRGTQKLYALMDRAGKARQRAKRGQNTGLAKGLGAIA